MFTIWGKGPQQRAREEIDGAETRQEARYLVGEYRLAFGAGWKIWFSRQPRKPTPTRCSPPKRKGPAPMTTTTASEPDTHLASMSSAEQSALKTAWAKQSYGSDLPIEDRLKAKAPRKRVKTAAPAAIE